MGGNGVQKQTRKALILVPLSFRYSLVAFQEFSSPKQYSRNSMLPFPSLRSLVSGQRKTNSSSNKTPGTTVLSGSEEGVLWKRGLFRTGHCLEILESLENLEFLDNPQTVENKGDSDHFLEILENLEIVEILEIPPVKRPLS